MEELKDDFYNKFSDEDFNIVERVTPLEIWTWITKNFLPVSNETVVEINKLFANKLKALQLEVKEGKTAEPNLEGIIKLLEE